MTARPTPGRRRSGHVSGRFRITGMRAPALGLLAWFAMTPVAADPVALAALDDLDATTLDLIAARVRANETGGVDSRLLWWNEGEHFLSLGIGHAIWYPPGVPRPFRESFPALLEHLLAAGVELPGWLSPATPCPWPRRDAWLAAVAAGDRRVSELLALMQGSVREQAGFLVVRLRADLETLFDGYPDTAVQRLRTRLRRVAATPGGVYVLIDYVNFKGDGRHPGERYAGQGWGLLQVLAAMSDDPATPALDAFADAATAVLQRRVENAPPQRNESRWLAGWRRRVDGYRPR